MYILFDFDFILLFISLFVYSFFFWLPGNFYLYTWYSFLYVHLLIYRFLNIYTHIYFFIDVFIPFYLYMFVDLFSPLHIYRTDLYFYLLQVFNYLYW